MSPPIDPGYPGTTTGTPQPSIIMNLNFSVLEYNTDRISAKQIQKALQAGFAILQSHSTKAQIVITFCEKIPNANRCLKSQIDGLKTHQRQTHLHRVLWKFQGSLRFCLIPLLCIFYYIEMHFWCLASWSLGF